VLESFGPFACRFVVLEIMGKLDQPPVERHPRVVVRIVPDFGDPFDNLDMEPGRHPLIEPVWRPPRSSLPHQRRDLPLVVDDHAHTGLVDLATVELHRWLVDNQREITALVGERAPWWTPQWLDERVSSRLHAEIIEWVAEIRDHPDHHARMAFDRLLIKLAHDLQHDEATRERAERLKHRLLTQPQVATTSVALWDALRRALIASLQEEDGLLRRRAAEELVALGERLMTDEALGARFDAMLSDLAAYVVNNYGREVATIISETVNRWDGKETADRIELHVGRDLQFIRINGTVVGGLTGLVIHTFSMLI